MYDEQIAPAVCSYSSNEMFVIDYPAVNYQKGSLNPLAGKPLLPVCFHYTQ